MPGVKWTNEAIIAYLSEKEQEYRNTKGSKEKEQYVETLIPTVESLLDEGSHYHDLDKVSFPSNVIYLYRLLKFVLENPKPLQQPS